MARAKRGAKDRSWVHFFLSQGKKLGNTYHSFSSLPESCLPFKGFPVTLNHLTHVHVCVPTRPETTPYSASHLHYLLLGLAQGRCFVTFRWMNYYLTYLKLSTICLDPCHPRLPAPHSTPSQRLFVGPTRPWLCCACAFTPALLCVTRCTHHLSSSPEPPRRQHRRVAPRPSAVWLLAFRSWSSHWWL